MVVVVVVGAAAGAVLPCLRLNAAARANARVGGMLLMWAGAGELRAPNV